MSYSPIQLNSNINGLITCIKSDHYNKKIAISGSDGKITIYQLKANDQIESQITFQAHNHSIWGLSWGHPKFGNYLASCSSDRTVKIWKEISPLNFELVYSFTKHNDTVTNCEFSPYQYGLILFCSSLDGNVSIHSMKPGNLEWTGELHKGINPKGVISFSWGPALPPVDFETDFDNLGNDDNQHYQNYFLPKTVMAICGDGSIKMIKIHSNDKVDVADVPGIGDSYKDFLPIDIAWLNCVAYTEHTVALCCSNKKVIILSQKEGNEWIQKSVIELKEDCSKVCFSHCGAYLGVTMKDNKIRLFQENFDSTWEEIQNGNNNVNADRSFQMSQQGSFFN